MCYERGVQLSVLLFWLSRLQLPGHAFGLALPWLGRAFGCLRLVVDFLARVPCFCFLPFIACPLLLRSATSLFSFSAVANSSAPSISSGKLQLQLLAASFLVISTKKSVTQMLATLSFIFIFGARQPAERQRLRLRLWLRLRMLHDLRAQVKPLAGRTRKS